MIEVIPNFWAPNIGHGAKFFERARSTGLPSHNWERVQMCLSACQNQGRRRVVIDGGAYVGTWLAHLVQHFGKIIAYEPAPENFECLVRNIILRKELQAGCGEIVSYPYALSDKTGEVFITSPRAIKMYGNVGRRAYAWRVTEKGGPDSLLVKSVSIDDSNLDCLDLLKLDVEGHELTVLEGAKQTILRCKPVIMIEDKLDPKKEASAYLVELGMTCTGSSKHDYLFEWPKPNRRRQCRTRPSLSSQ